MEVTTRSRRLVGAGVWTICLLLIVRLFFVERFHIPTGSMAPSLMGSHRRVDCPRCSCSVCVDQYNNATFCPNCGKSPLRLHHIPLTDGDHIVAAKMPFATQTPSRWSLILFRLFGEIFIKRLIGLPGECIALIDGDVYGDGMLLRKSYDEARRMRILVFDNDCQPKPDGWRQRWERRPNSSSAADLLETDCRVLRLTTRPDETQWLTYRHFQLDDGKCRPVSDEYAYNGLRSVKSSTVHDFMVACEIETGGENGWLMLAIDDGGDQVVVRIPVGRPVAGSGKSSTRPFPEQRRFRTLTTPAARQLERGRHYRLALALVDRRVTCRVDGVDVMPPLDLPAMPNRSPVKRPFAIGAHGLDMVVRHVRLFRDVHYSDDGRNGVGGNEAVLGPDEYFVLGDNSTNSRDSRFWPNGGAVTKKAIIGQPILLHFPHRRTERTFFGKSWQIPDWSRIGWLR